MINLPVELIIMIISYLTDYLHIRSLIHGPNRILRDMTREAIEVLDNYDSMSTADLLLLRNLRLIKSCLICNDYSSLHHIASHRRLEEVTIRVRGYNITNFLNFICRFHQDYCTPNTIKEIPATRETPLNRSDKRNRRRYRQRQQTAINTVKRDLSRLRLTLLYEDHTYMIRDGIPVFRIRYALSDFYPSDYKYVLENFRRYSPLHTFDCHWINGYDPIIIRFFREYLSSLYELKAIIHLDRRMMSLFSLIETLEVVRCEPDVTLSIHEWNYSSSQTLRVLDVRFYDSPEVLPRLKELYSHLDLTTVIMVPSPRPRKAISLAEWAASMHLVHDFR